MPQGQQGADGTGKNKEGKDKVTQHRDRRLFDSVVFRRIQFVSCLRCTCYVHSQIMVLDVCSDAWFSNASLLKCDVLASVVSAV